MSGSVLLPDYLPLTAPPRSVPGQPAEGRPALDWERFIADRLAAGSKDLYAECLAEMEEQLLTRVLQRTGGNQLRAAELLGITRGSLRHKLRALGLTVERSVTKDDDADE
jgi:two-component system nitrogen regulation response regulator GlnG